MSVKKIAIIGAGSVGSAIANNMVTMGIDTEIVFDRFIFILV